MPTQRERIEATLDEQPMCDDCLSIRAAVHPRQAVNQICNRLSKTGGVIRSKYLCPVCGATKIINSLQSTPGLESGSRVLALNSIAVPALPDLLDVVGLVRKVSSCLRLPNPSVVSQHDDSVFPSIRDQKNRLTIDTIGNSEVLLDDNTTPRWALLWSHGIGYSAHPKGWTFAHVWPFPKDVHSYTHLANLAMMPEYLASLTDKDGPLGGFLRYHSWDVYGWKPPGQAAPIRPGGYGEITWTYLDAIENSQQFVRNRVTQLNNQRTRLLQSIESVASS